MTTALDTRDPLVRSTSRGAARRERERICHYFHKIQEAAFDGQNGSARYALDRLALIQAIATTALQQLEK